MNNSSQLVWSWDGEPFGATPANGSVGPVTTFTYNLRFPGQYYDQETGYHQNRWREYDPKQGKYLQSDPLGLAAGVNTYAYVESSPLMFIDPWGLIPITEEEGQLIVNVAMRWGLANVPYKLIGAASSLSGGDCSGITWRVYNEAGFPYQYSSSRDFPSNPAFKPAKDNIPQQGDIGWWNGHILIYDKNLKYAINDKGKQYFTNLDAWTATRPGRSYGPGSTSWWASRGNVTWYRYEKQ